MRVYTRLDDIDRDAEQAGTGDFNANGKSYGVAVFSSYATSAFAEDPLIRIYGPSEDTAFQRAEEWARKNGHYLEHQVVHEMSLTFDDLLDNYMFVSRFKTTIRQKLHGMAIDDTYDEIIDPPNERDLGVGIELNGEHIEVTIYNKEV